MTTVLIIAIVASATNSFDDSIFRRVNAIMTAESFVQLHAVTAQVEDIPFRFDATYLNEERGLAVTFDGGRLSLASKQQLSEMWGMDSAVTPPAGSITGLPIGEKCSHSWDKYGGFVRVLSDRYQIRILVSVPRGSDPITTPNREEYAKSLCERLTRVILADAMAIDLADDGRELGTSHITGAETPKDGFVTLDAWATRAHTTVTYDAKTASATFTFGGKSVKLLLAADKAIVDGHEVSLGGKFVMARGARWFVPDVELTAAVR